ncbi:MAG: glycosyltransferase family 2 protein [Candidatus Andersenbacteria bacterium]
MKSVGAVIVTHNSEEYITECVQSLIKRGVQEVVVVDSASSDKTQAVVSSLPVRLIALPENKGFGAAANVGLSEIDSPHVILLNPDAVLQSGKIQTAAEYMDKHPSVAVLGFLLQGEAGDIERSSWGQRVSPLSMLTRHISKDATVPTVPQPVGWVSGGAMMLRRSEALALGGFDESFFLYWEDVDLCRRLEEDGKNIVLYPDVSVRHIRGASLTDLSRKTRLYDESADRYFRKHYATPIWLLYRLLRHTYRLFSPQAR